MAQPQIESFTISDDGTIITAKYDQILYGKGTFANSPIVDTPSDYSSVFYSWNITSKDFYAGFDTLTFVSYLTQNGSENRQLPVYALTNPDLVTSLTTNFQVTDVVNSQGEAPVNVTNLVLDTSNTPPATGINPPYDVLDTFNKKLRKQASRDKILCVYNTAAVYGIYDEPLIDAYFDEYGITNHIKVGIDFSIAANTDNRWWTSWGLDVYNQVIDNGIEQVCCGPLSPTDMSQGSTSNVQVDLSNCLGSLKTIKAKLEQENASGLESELMNGDDIYYNQDDDSNLRNSKVSYYQGSPDLNAGETTGSFGMGTGYTKGSFRANLGSLDTETFEGLLGFPTSIQVPGLHFDQYEPSDLFWNIVAKPHQSRTLRMPCWRIGYFPYAQKPFLPTTTIIRQMVKNSKAAAMPTARNKEEKVLLLNTFYTTPALLTSSDTVYLSELWEGLGYTKSFFGATNKPQIIDDLTNVPGTVVGDTGLTKYEWQGLNPPANGAIDYIGEIQVTPQANDATNVYLDSIWMEQWDGGGAIGPGMAYRAKSTGTAFPILADIIVDQTRNFNGNYDGSIRNALQCKPGGIRFNATSHGQRAGIWDLGYGASASVASLHEPQVNAVRYYPQMISELLKGHTIAAAHSFANRDIATSSSVWGDGLLQPYYEQAQEEDMNNVKFELIAAPSYTSFQLAFLPAITTAGTTHSTGDIITFNGSQVGSGIKIHVTGVDGSGGVTAYEWHSGGLGWGSNEVATQANTTGSGINTVLTLDAIETTYPPVGFGFFSDPLTQAVAAAITTNNATLFNSAGVEFAFSQFNPDIPDLHALVAAPSSNGFARPASIGLWVEGDIASWPYGDNVVIYHNGVAYPFLESYITEGSALWNSAAQTGIAGYSRLEWLTDPSKDHPAPTIIEGDSIGMSLAVPERQSSKSVISRSVISHNTES
jgi:hypothetical protein